MLSVVLRRSGPRVKIGIYQGCPTKVCPHASSGRADYFGALVNRQGPTFRASSRISQSLLAMHPSLKSNVWHEKYAST